MKRIVLMLGLIGVLMACDKALLSPQPEWTSSRAARVGTDPQPTATNLMIGKKARLTHYTISKNTTGAYNIVFHYDRAESESVAGISLRDAKAINELLRLELPGDFELNRQLITKWADVGGQITATVPDLFAWLQANPAVANSIVWQDANEICSWPSWTALEQTQLWVAFQKAWQGSSIYVPDVPENQLAIGESAITVLSVTHAWAYFRASVAHSLALELGNRVNWSVRNYSEQQLAQLFNSREMFYWNESPLGYMISNGYHGFVTQGPPLKSYQFMKDHDMISTNRLNTISRAIDWCRFNLSHYLGRSSGDNMEAHWQYRGAPPMMRILSGTFNPEQPLFGVRHWTAGCHGTAGFLRMLLRTVNIPVKMVFGYQHAQVWFMSDNYYLDHADAPYDSRIKDPAIGAGELLINQDRYMQWFGPGVSQEVESKNVGRRNRELILAYLPNYLLRKYCEDIKAGKSHAKGQVYEQFSLNYTVAQLENQNLWGRMDAKIALMGGCSHIPNP
ncbi:hypothetical protein ACO2Q8_22640 [Larkinella sp. VNQ87]|uniref:hypothetical protein n=1 Tax=Larkinella sp. VNQ87 TaxID=3400921 RepID=UPI003C06617A